MHRGDPLPRPIDPILTSARSHFVHVAVPRSVSIRCLHRRCAAGFRGAGLLTGSCSSSAVEYIGPSRWTGRPTQARPVPCRLVAKKARTAGPGPPWELGGSESPRRGRAHFNTVRVRVVVVVLLSAASAEGKSAIVHICIVSRLLGWIHCITVCHDGDLTSILNYWYLWAIDFAEGALI